MKNIFIRLICCFVPNRKLRHKIRKIFVKNSQNESIQPEIAQVQNTQIDENFLIVGDNNLVVIVDENGNKETLNHSLPGLRIQIKGNNNEIVLPKGDVFIGCYINIQSDNAKVHIGNTKYKIQNLFVSTCCGSNQYLSIGNDFECFGSFFNLVESFCSITIGNDCLFSNTICFWPTDGHSIIDTKTNKIINEVTGQIKIGNHVWICEGVKILKNASINNDSIIGAASVVSKKFEESNICICGNPAQIVRKNITWDKKNPTTLKNEGVK